MGCEECYCEYAKEPGQRDDDDLLGIYIIIVVGRSYSVGDQGSESIYGEYCCRHIKVDEELEHGISTNEGRKRIVIRAL